MAETTTTSANDLSYSAAIEPALLGVAAELGDFMPTCREFDIRNRGSNAIDIVRPQSNHGTPGDRGAAVDTELNATEATSLTATTWATDKVTGTAVELGIMFEPSYNVFEDAVDGIDVWGAIEGEAMVAMVTAINDDICALFASISNSTGTSGAAMTIANMLAAQVGVRTRGWKNNGGVYVLDTGHADDAEAALIGTNAAQAVFALSADRLLGYMPSNDNGLSNGHVMTFRNSPVWVTGLTDTANAGVDAVSCYYTPGGPGNDPVATFGLVWKRLFQIEFFRDIKKRTIVMVLTARLAPFELTDGSATKIVAAV